MSRKRTSLDTILEPPPAAAQPQPAEPTPPPRQVRQQTVYLPLPVYEQLRRLAFEERVKMHSLLLEGLDRVFKERGLAGIDELKDRIG